MLIHELTTDECLAVVACAEFGRLACAHGDQPYIVPIFYAFDVERRCLYAFSTVGQKIEWMRENPLVCVEIEDIRDKTHWTTVLVFGRYEELGDTADDVAARRAAQRLFQERPDWWLPAVAKVPTRDERAAVVVYRIQIDRLTGRRAGARPPGAVIG